MPRIPGWLLALGSVLLIVTLFVLPMFQLNSATPESDLWPIVSLGLSSTVVLILVALQWFRARPARVLAGSLTAASPESIVVPVGIEPGKLAVLAADAQGVALASAGGSPVRVPWVDVVDLSEEWMDSWPNRRLRVVTVSGTSDFVVVLLGTGAVRPLRNQSSLRLISRLRTLRLNSLQGIQPPDTSR